MLDVIVGASVVLTLIVDYIVYARARDTEAFVLAEVQRLEENLRVNSEYYNNRLDFVDADIRDIVTPTTKKKEVKRAKAK